MSCLSASSVAICYRHQLVEQRRSALVARKTIVRRLNWPCHAFKRPSEVQPPVSTPEDKTLQSLVETGIRGSLAVTAACVLHLNLFSYIHGDLPNILRGVQLATPCLALEAALLMLSNMLNTPAAARIAAALGSRVSSVAVMQETVDAIYLHTMRYSLIGAAPGVQRLLLETAAQLSEDLLARGVLLGCSTAWLTARLVEANICITPDHLGATRAAAAAATDTTLCSTGLEWLAAAAICCMIGARYAVHSKTSSTTLRSLRAAEAAEAAARQQLLRYEPKAVQDAAAAAAAAAAPAGSQGDTLMSQDDGTAELITQLLHGWLGLRFVIGQGAMFAAFITTGDLMASFAAGLVMQLMSSTCCEQYLYSPRHR